MRYNSQLDMVKMPMQPTTRLSIPLLIAIVLGLCACQMHDPVYRPVATDGFERTLAAWRKARPGGSARTLQQQQILEAAENMLLMQRADGGWPTGTHPLRILTEAERQTFTTNKTKDDSSFRHHNVFPQVFYLSHVYLQTGDVRYRNAARDGIEWVIANQFYNGGWPLHPAADEGVIDTRVTLEALTFLRKIAAGKMPYGYIPYDARRKVAEAVRKGDEWLLRVQQSHDSRTAIWARAYDLKSSKPIATDEVPVPVMDVALSVDVVRYLMAIERPPAAVVRAVNGAVEWYRHHSVQQWQVQHNTPELALMAQSSMPLPGPTIWPRYYDALHHQPLKDNASLLTVESRDWFAANTTSPWYGDWPTKLLREDYPRWREINLPEPIARTYNH